MSLNSTTNINDLGYSVLEESTLPVSKVVLCNTFWTWMLDSMVITQWLYLL